MGLDVAPDACARGTSFRELLDAARYDIARQLLRDTRISVIGIAAALDGGSVVKKQAWPGMVGILAVNVAADQFR